MKDDSDTNDLIDDSVAGSYDKQLENFEKFKMSEEDYRQFIKDTEDI